MDPLILQENTNMRPCRDIQHYHGFLLIEAQINHRMSFYLHWESDLRCQRGPAFHFCFAASLKPCTHHIPLSLHGEVLQPFFPQIGVHLQQRTRFYRCMVRIYELQQELSHFVSSFFTDRELPSQEGTYALMHTTFLDCLACKKKREQKFEEGWVIPHLCSKICAFRVNGFMLSACFTPPLFLIPCGSPAPTTEVLQYELPQRLLTNN